MLLELLPCEFSICRDFDPHEVNLEQPFTFVSHTDNEWSLVCQTKHVPKSAVRREDSWSAMRVVGQLEFTLVGVIARLSGVLAANDISIFAISTFDTDYLLVKQPQLKQAMTALANADECVIVDISSSHGLSFCDNPYMHV